jgi:class 3 adenylate cyclase
MADGLPGQVLDGGNQPANDVSMALSTAEWSRLGKNVKGWFNNQNGNTLTGALAFVPFILQQSYWDGHLDETKTVIHRGSGGVVFSDASGFTALTEKLAKKSNGAELLSQCLTAFFTPLIDLINAYRGDTIKFSGDALTIYFPSVDDTKCSAFNGIVPPHGSYGLPDLGPHATAVLRASACCIEIHKRLHMFDTGVDGVRLCLHIGVGCGEISILQVGGVIPPETHVPRIEYLISGAPLEQISVAEPLAKNGETCLSPQAWEFVKECVHEGRILEDEPSFHILERMDETKYTFPTIKYATQLYDTRNEKLFKLEQLPIIRRYIPSSVFKQIECGTLQYVNEMRNISVIFISGSGLDVMSESGPRKAQDLMSSVQRVCYAHEGTLNKFLIDDKGMLFLLVFGLPPLVHPDDPTRAVLACMEFVEVFKRLELVGRFGVTTGRSYCGVCGSAKRMEYTVLGDSVNLSARLMSNAAALGILVDEETSKHTTGEIQYEALAPIKVKGKVNAIPIFKPVIKETASNIGLNFERTIRFPWYDNPIDGSDVTSADVVTVSKQRVQQLCSVQRWAGIAKVMEMLGGTFNKAIHQKEQTIPTTAPRVKAPAGSPFAEGGIVVMEGETGLGKIELAEHIVMHCATQFQMMPIFGTMGPRPGQATRMARELLRSTIGVKRHLDANVHADDVQALEQILPQAPKASIDTLRELLGNANAPSVTARSSDVFDTAVKVVIDMLTRLKKQTPVLVVLQFENGSNLFPKTTREDEKTFWKMTSELTKLVQKEKQIAGLILCKQADQANEAVQAAKDTNSFMCLKGLTDDTIPEYMSNYLDIPIQQVPSNLKKFVSQVTAGNALFVRETLDQLVKESHLTVKPGQSAILGAGALQKISEDQAISQWNHTAMVGGTICTLESLDPIEAAALKMSTCFDDPFKLTDLAASSCSAWGGATHFELLRLFRAVHKLVERRILNQVATPALEANITTPRSGETPQATNPYGEMQYFQMQSVLIRTVGAAMILEAQKKSVKRNALIDRVLRKKLPEKMSARAAEKSVQHIPWYYERALRRMQ